MSSKRLFQKIKPLLLALVLFGGLSGRTLFAEGDFEDFTPKAQRARLAASVKSSHLSGKMHFSPLSLSGGTRLTVITPYEWMELSKAIQKMARGIHGEYIELFGKIPPLVSTLRLLDSESFYRETGAPRWTNAMYYRKQIYIPVAKKKNLDFENIIRSVKHEYMHSVIHALSDGRCPGWLDEGLAQWAEELENPALKPALANWLRYHDMIGLNLLQGGFTKLDEDMVPAAYAQSLFAAKYVMRRFGFKRIKNYLSGLKKGQSSEKAFQNAFKISVSAFEKDFNRYLRSWERNYKRFDS